MQDTKTCSDVLFMNSLEENNLFSEAGNALDSLSEGCSMGDGNENMVRGVRRLKYTSKSTGYHSFRKRISEDENIHHYSSCGCQFACGKECFCFLNKTCCEKYCGCPRSCKIRGCHCAKSQCRSKQCPCYAARRQCDPDVCRNCCIRCGDGTLGVPDQKGDNYECGNMQLLLKQQQKVLLGRSDVSGWGVFLKNSVEKNEYIGEYTGELVSQHEADKRGKIYDRVNSSYLFNLNNQYVLDAFRKGNKLKFANHSFDPNCYVKVLMVAGDHRVGIFAKQQICAGEEIFYNYGYVDDTAPDWIKKLKASGSKKVEHTPSSG